MGICAHVGGGVVGFRLNDQEHGNDLLAEHAPITGVTGQGGSCLPGLLLGKGCVF